MTAAASAKQMRQVAFAANLANHEDRLAIISQNGERLTYRQLAARVDEAAARLGPRKRLLMIEAANEVEPIVWYLGALRGGHCVLLTAADSAGQAEELAAIYQPDARLFKTGSQWTADVEAIPDRPLHPDLALLLSTSGTTGAVKLVRLSAGAIEANARSIAEYLSIAPGERAITTLPMHYSYGLSVIVSHLAAGATILLTGLSVIEPAFWEFFDREGGASLAGVPYTYELLERIGFRDARHPTLRTLTQAGGRLAPDMVELYARWARDRGGRFFVMYGQTEAVARMAYLPPDQALENAGAIGQPIPGGAFHLIGEDGRPLEGAKAVGELVYRGPNVMMGYAANAADLARGPELDELRTGDLASLGSNGFYRIEGRKSRFSKLFGMRISLDEIEASLSREQVKAAVAGDDSLIAVAVTGHADPDQIAAAMAERLGIPETALDVVAVDEFPTLGSGKIDYQGLLRQAKARSSLRRGSEPGDPRSSITAAFQHAFPNGPLDASKGFAALGGDSLSYVGLSLELERQLGFLPDHWEKRSVEELVALAPATPKTVNQLAPRALETEVLIRACAIVAVVLNHATSLWTVGGGADVLLLLAGYNLARYNRERLADGRGWDVLTTFLRRIILPYYVIMLGYFLIKRTLDPSSLLLVSNFRGRFGSMLEPYWFLELLFQCMLVMAAACAFRPVREAIARSPWRAGLVALAAALAVKVAVFAMLHHHRLINRTPDAAFYLLALGWCLQQASDVRRKVLVTAVALGVALLDVFGAPGIWQAYVAPANLTHAAWLIVATTSILWVPRISLPGLVRDGVAIVAAASYYIYLSHGVPVHVMVWMMHIRNPLWPLLASFATGIPFWWLMQSDMLRRLVRPAWAWSVQPAR
jgi:acyl-CoA synthetase (AMP-forming)/AMP-acid ligase II